MRAMPTREDMQQLQAGKATNANETAVRLALYIEFYEALQDGDTNTDAVSTGSMTEGEVIAMVKELNDNGFAVTLGSGTIQPSWA